MKENKCVYDIVKMYSRRGSEASAEFEETRNQKEAEGEHRVDELLL